jgi:hypothetical protein
MFNWSLIEQNVGVVVTSGKAELWHLLAEAKEGQEKKAVRSVDRWVESQLGTCGCETGMFVTQPPG